LIYNALFVFKSIGNEDVDATRDNITLVEVGRG
jgi:hypothetical protein